MSSTIFTPVSGIMTGTLTEDLIETVKNTKQPYCSVLLDDYEEDDEFPLTLVPYWGMLLPLKKGDKVEVSFLQGDSLYPVLHKPLELADTFYSNFQLPTHSGLVEVPSTEDTVSVTQISPDYWLVVTDGYIAVHKDENIYLMSSTGQMIYSNKLQVYADEIVIEPGFSKLDIGNNTITLGDALKDILSILEHIVTPAAFTSPTGPCVYANVADFVTVQTLKLKLNTLIKGVM